RPARTSRDGSRKAGSVKPTLFSLSPRHSGQARTEIDRVASDESNGRIGLKAEQILNFKILCQYKRFSGPGLTTQNGVHRQTEIGRSATAIAEDRPRIDHSKNAPIAFEAMIYPTI
ncbi:hypothetical protein, partial [Rubripirellula obstinata]|uniref:hypothetical protein n=1 Tax=Rubripirellula obstinata TaxID=406547 RepID=UPI001EE4DB71